MLELTVRYSKGRYYPMRRHTGVREWQYVQRDGVIVSCTSQEQAEGLLEVMRTELMARGRICHILAARP
ncbi:MAG TPA: hypothetical protein VHZ51_18985 [Ktedonobacteraceae bacterium]|jgi:hypothetical protein|nr:hypothetical protein [Ktedonobacteraceae bacterium]